MKIAIIGYSGSGKSTLAGLYAKKYGLPVLYVAPGAGNLQTF